MKHQIACHGLLQLVVFLRTTRRFGDFYLCFYVLHDGSRIFACAASIVQLPNGSQHFVSFARNPQHSVVQFGPPHSRPHGPCASASLCTPRRLGAPAGLPTPRLSVVVVLAASWVEAPALEEVGCEIWEVLSVSSALLRTACPRMHVHLSRMVLLGYRIVDLRRSARSRGIGSPGAWCRTGYRVIWHSPTVLLYP